MDLIEHASAQKLRGGYYTDASLAEYMLCWVRGVAPRALLEPSAGDGALLRPLAFAVPMPSLDRVVACELDPAEAAKTRVALQGLAGVRAEVHVGDFLGWVLARGEDAAPFDAAVGNPPFVRYQYLGEDVQARAGELMARCGLRFTQHMNAWVPFVVGALRQLRPGGRLAMVIPSELIHLPHAQPARDYLLRQCSRVLLLDPEELWFEGSLQGVVLLFAEKREAPSSQLARVAITPIRGRASLDEPAEVYFDRAAYTCGESLTGKWMSALLSARERDLLGGLAQATGVRRFKDVASARVGILTGANEFFFVPDDVVKTYDLGAYVHPMFGRSEHVEGVIYDAARHAENRRRGARANLVWFQGEALTQGATRYIAQGEAQGLHRRFKCRIRTPWYSMSSVSTAPVGMFKRAHDYPRLVLNAAGAYTTDTVYRIAPRQVAPERLVGRFVNSLTALGAELEGRHYGGGVLELVPSELGRLLLPWAEEGPCRLKTLDALCRRGAGAQEILAVQDGVLLPGVGLSPVDVQQLQGAWHRLRVRRQRGSAGVADGA